MGTIARAQPNSNSYHWAASAKLHQLQLDKGYTLKYESKAATSSGFFQKTIFPTSQREHTKGKMTATGHRLETVIWIFCFA